MMAPRDDADEIKARLNDRLEQVVDRFWPGAVRRGKLAYCAPASNKDLGSFVVYLGQMGKYTRGSWVRSSAGIGGDELNLYAYGLTGNHRANAEVFRSAREFVGLDNARQESPEEQARRESLQAAAAAKREADDRRAREHAQARTRTAGEIWAESVPIAGTHAEAYLLARGIPVPPAGWPEALRFHKRLTYDLDPTMAFPCLVCRVDDLTEELVGVWRVYLAPDKPSKASVDNAKLGLGAVAGGAIRLGGVAAHVGLAEGVETALACAALIKYRYPCWSAMSTSGIAGFEPPMEVERVTCFPDSDKPWKRHQDDLVLSEPAGRAAARKLGERMKAIGLRFDQEREPKIFQDYLDVWNQRRRIEERA